LNGFLKNILVVTGIVVPAYLILFGFLAYGWPEITYSEKEQKTINGTWTVVIPNNTLKNIPYKQPVIQMLCSLTFEKPYYDCDELWLMFYVYGEVDGVVCDYEAAGCAYQEWNMIWLENKNFLDDCGRTPLQHELLHLKYGENTAWLIHDYENCTNW